MFPMSADDRCTEVAGRVGHDAAAKLRRAISAIEESDLASHNVRSDAAGQPPSPGNRGVHGRERLSSVVLSGLTSGATHEWFGTCLGAEEPDATAIRNGPWFPPLQILADIARHALQSSRCDADRVLWIGRRCWPYPYTLAPHRDDGDSAKCSLLARSILIDPASRDERVWAIDLALRCPMAAVVIADASGMRMAESRRLQLAAAAGGTLGLLVRPPWERRELSAARTRWLVRAAPSNTTDPRGTIERLRCKGLRPMKEDDAWRWAMRHDHETGHVHLVPDVRDRPAAPARPGEASSVRNTA